MRRLSLQIYWTFVSILLLFVVLLMIAWGITRPDLRERPALEKLGEAAGMLLPDPGRPVGELEALLSDRLSTPVGVELHAQRGQILIDFADLDDLEAGAQEEVRALEAQKLDPALPAMKAHGVPWLIRHLRGEISLEEAAAGSVMDTRRYAKRQLTWFRNQMKDWPWAEAATAEAEIRQAIG